MGKIRNEGNEKAIILEAPCMSIITNGNNKTKQNLKRMTYYG